MINDTLFLKFKERAEAISAEVHRFSKKDDAIGFIIDLIKKEAPADANSLWADSGLLTVEDRRSITERVSNLSFDVTRELAAKAKIGISQMDWAIAATGTLAQDASKPQQRLVSMLSEMHIAIVHTSRIVIDLPSALSNLDVNKMPFLAFVTGPSRTADIERVLTIGVHGPERLIIVFVDNIGEE